MVLLKSFRVLNRGSINRSWYAWIESHNMWVSKKITFYKEAYKPYYTTLYNYVRTWLKIMYISRIYKII